jgi:hypothetical protein
MSDIFKKAATAGEVITVGVGLFNGIAANNVPYQQEPFVSESHTYSQTQKQKQNSCSLNSPQKENQKAEIMKKGREAADMDDYAKAKKDSHERNRESNIANQQEIKALKSPKPQKSQSKKLFSSSSNNVFSKQKSKGRSI